MESIAKQQIESFAGLTDIFIGEVVNSANHDGFVRCIIHKDLDVNYIMVVLYKLYQEIQITQEVRILPGYIEIYSCNRERKLEG